MIGSWDNLVGRGLGFGCGRLGSGLVGKNQHTVGAGSAKVLRGLGTADTGLFEANIR